MSQKSGSSGNQAGQELREPEPPELEGWLSKLKHSQMVGLRTLDLCGVKAIIHRPLTAPSTLLRMLQSFFGAWNRRFFRINRQERTLE